MRAKASYVHAVSSMHSHNFMDQEPDPSPKNHEFESPDMVFRIQMDKHHRMWLEMDPHGSIWAHTKSNERKMARDHF